MYADGKAQAQKHKRDLIDAISKCARPSVADAFLEEGAERVRDAVDERVDENVAAWEAGFGQVRDDHAADGEGVDESGVEDEGHEMLVQNLRLQVEVGGDHNPGGGEGEETEKRDAGALAAGATGFHNVERAGKAFC